MEIFQSKKNAFVISEKPEISIGFKSSPTLIFNNYAKFRKGDSGKFSAKGKWFSQTGKTFLPELHYKINVPQDGQTRLAKLSSQLAN